MSDTDLTFDGYPHLGDLLSGTGVVGYDYYHVALTNIRKAQDAGLSLVQGLPAYTIIGPKGRADAVLMCHGERIAGASSLSAVCELYADEALEAVTGLPRELDDPGEELADVEKLMAEAKKPEVTTQAPGAARPTTAKPAGPPASAAK